MFHLFSNAAGRHAGQFLRSHVCHSRDEAAEFIDCKQSFTNRAVERIREFARSLEEFGAELVNDPESEDAKKQIAEINSKLRPTAR